jgi:hypothetical protein
MRDSTRLQSPPLHQDTVFDSKLCKLWNWHRTHFCVKQEKMELTIYPFITIIWLIPLVRKIRPDPKHLQVIVAPRCMHAVRSTYMKIQRSHNVFVRRKMTSNSLSWSAAGMPSALLPNGRTEIWRTTRGNNVWGVTIHAATFSTQLSNNSTS